MQIQSLRQRELSLFSKPTPLIGAIMKREAPYIVEWVAWHRLQGFDLLIADNCREGPQTELLLKLADAGLIRYVDFRHTEVTPQLAAYHQIIRHALWEGYRYLGFMDADEFFGPRTHDGLGGADLVAGQLEQKRIKAVSFRWCVFGSDGHERYGDGLLMERFTRRGRSEHPTNQYVKSFVRLSSIFVRSLLAPKGVITDPHTFQISKRRYCLDGRRGIRSGHYGDRYGFTNWNHARIRHYALKSREEFSMKRVRGNGIFPPGHELEASVYWSRFDLNDIDDPMESGLLDKLKASIGDINQTIN